LIRIIQYAKLKILIPINLAGSVRSSGGVAGPGAAPSWLVFGTEPVSPPLDITLQDDGRVVTIASDGLAPFAVHSQR